MLIMAENLNKDLIKQSLGSSFKENYTTSAEQAKSVLLSKPFELILISDKLKEGDPFQLCSWIRNQNELKHIPVFFLSEDSDSKLKVVAFHVGADDFIGIPFDSMEFQARANRAVARFKDSHDQTPSITAGPLTINVDQQRAQIEYANGLVEIDLTPTEFKILWTLTRRQQQIFTRDQLISAIWGETVHITDRAVDTHVSTLRRKLGPISKAIESVYGMGYRFNLSKIKRNSK